MTRVALLIAALVGPSCQDSRATGPGDGAPGLGPGDAPGGGAGGGGPGAPEGEGEGEGGVPAGGDGAEGDPGGDAPDGGGEGEGPAPGPGPGPGDECAREEVRCRDDALPQQCDNGRWIDAFPCGRNHACVEGRCASVQRCDPGAVDGCSDDRSLRVCGDNGLGFAAVPCPADAPLCFRGECGHKVCDAADRRCRGEFSIEECSGDGTQWNGVASCDPREEEVCLRGACVRGCAVALKSRSYLGCEFWSVDLPQYDDPASDPDAAPHAVVVANTGERLARVVVETRSGAVVPRPVDIPPGDARVVPFPRLDVDGTGRSLRSFRLSADEPVIAYQFNPLNNVHVYSNDASLLLPSNAIGREYRIMAWPGGVDIPGFGPQAAWFTLVAPNPGTTHVRIEFACDIIDGGEFRGIRRGDVREVEMQQWEVLNFEAETTLMGALRGESGDPTGSLVRSDQPLVVFAGHKEAVIGEPGPPGPDGEPGNNCCADHLEEQMFPVPAWGTRHFAVHSPPRGTEPDYWRVMAANDGTTVTTNPVIDGLHGVTLDAGRFVEINTTRSFEIDTSGPVLVGQYLASQQSAGVEDWIGDPASLLAVPVEQFRSDYGVLTPENYARDYITVIKPVDAIVDLDGRALPPDDFTPFGSGQWSYLHVDVEPGPHMLVSLDDVPFAVNMYGYDAAVSYGYPGGLDLSRDGD